MRKHTVVACVWGRLNLFLLSLVLLVPTFRVVAAEPEAVIESPIRITASFSVLADVCAQVGGEWVQVQTLVDWDQDSHMFMPHPEHLKTLLGSELLVSSGLGLESWLPRMIGTMSYRGRQFVAGAHVQTIMVGADSDHHGHEHAAGQADPHWWHSLREMRKVVTALVPVLESLRPQVGTYFRERAAQFTIRLDALQQRTEMLMLSLPPSHRYLIVPHNAFAYLARDFGLQMHSLMGLSTAGQANSKEMVALIRLIREQSIPAIFTETTTDARLMTQIQKEAGVHIAGALISGALSRTLAPDYLAMMQYNIELIAAGLKAELGPPK